MRKIISLFVCLMLFATVFSGCGSDSANGGSNGTESTNQTAQNGSSSSEETNEKIEPITFTMFHGGTNTQYENFESPVAQKIKEATGVTLKIEYAVGDPKQKISLLAASGEYPDLIFPMQYFPILVDAGGLVKLDDLIEKHGPNIKKFYGDFLARHRYSLEDPSIYYLGSSQIEPQPMEANGGFCLQHAVVKELGFPQIKTVKDFENAIKQYKEKYPTIDGQPTIGLSLLADDWRIWISTTNPAMYATQAPPGCSDSVIEDINDKELNFVEHFFRSDEREYYRWLNHMNDIGLLDPESFVQKYDQYLAKISSGRVLAVTDASWEYSEAMNALRQAKKPERCYGMYPVVLKEGLKNSSIASIANPGYSPNGGVAITKSCKEPERAIRFLDWMCTEEAQILRFWGIEGEHYTIENGIRVKTPERKKGEVEDPNYGKKTGVGVYTYPFPEHGPTSLDSTGQPITASSVEDIIKGYTDVEKEVLKAYGAKLWIDLWPSFSEFPYPPWGAGWTIQPEPESEASVAQQKIDQLQFKYVPKAIMAKPEKFDAIYDEFLEEIEKSGVKKVQDYMRIKYRERMKLWGTEVK